MVETIDMTAEPSRSEKQSSVNYLSRLVLTLGQWQSAFGKVDSPISAFADTTSEGYK
jgi:hypothetical protein